MPHYFSEKQGSPFVLEKINIKTSFGPLQFYSSSGVFSKDKLDKGSELLINSALIRDDSDVLDLGCGYGVVGVFIAKFFPSTNLLLTDVNERAVKLAKKNIRFHKLTNAHARFSFVFDDIPELFDTILLNPPQSAGKKICFEMIDQSLAHLKKDGNLQVVIRKKKGGKIIHDKMLESFGNIEELAKKAGYVIFLSKKQVDSIPNTRDSVKEIRETRRKLSKEKFDLDEINKPAD